MATPVNPVERIYPNELFVRADGTEVDGELHCQLGDDGLILDFWPVVKASPGEEPRLADSPVAACGLDLAMLTTMCNDAVPPEPTTDDSPREFGVNLEDRPRTRTVHFGIVDTVTRREVARIVFCPNQSRRFSPQMAADMIGAYNARLKAEHEKQQRIKRRIRQQQHQPPTETICEDHDQPASGPEPKPNPSAATAGGPQDPDPAGIPPIGVGDDAGHGPPTH